MRLSLDLPMVFRRTPVIRGLSVGPRSAFEEMNAAIETWRLKPVIDRVFARHELREALDYMATGAQFGKIALRVYASSAGKLTLSLKRGKVTYLHRSVKVKRGTSTLALKFSATMTRKLRKHAKLTLKLSLGPLHANVVVKRA